jgi:GMP synthase-like glutamine amidotransferase
MDRKIVIIQHSVNEGPGTIDRFFVSHGWSVEVIDLSQGGHLPESFDSVAAVVSLGGPMNVYEENLYPFLHEEDQFITRLIIEEIPFLGICLGAQILAKACGAEVFKAPAEEIGWDAVTVTDQGRKDRLFLHVPDRMMVFQWHGDTFHIPAGGSLLAEGKVCPNQAFRAGANAYGLQFHIEVTPDMVKRWMEGERGRVNVNRILRQTEKVAESLQKQSSQVLDNFKRIIESSVRIRRVIGMFVEDEKARRARRPVAWWQREELGGLKLLALNG